VRLSRREFLGTTIGLAGAVTVSPVPPATAGTAEWRELLAAANNDGKVVVNTFPGDGYKRALKAFTEAFPDIKIEHTKRSARSARSSTRREARGLHAEGR
jgi:hypothetical protein